MRSVSTASAVAGEMPSSVAVVSREQHLALTLIVAGRVACLALGFRDLRRKSLALRDQFEQTAVEFVEASAQFGEIHAGDPGWEIAAI